MSCCCWFVFVLKEREEERTRERKTFRFIVFFFSTLFALLLTLSLSLSLFFPPLQNLSFFFFNSYAKVVPTTLDASVVGGRASREADARIRDAEGGGSFPPSSSSSSVAAAFPLHAVHTYQYSISEKFTPLDPKAPSIPTVSLSYDMSPLTLALSRPRTPLWHAAVRLVAVGGGVRALASFFGALVHFVAGRKRRTTGVGGSGKRSSESG